MAEYRFIRTTDQPEAPPDSPATLQEAEQVVMDALVAKAEGRAYDEDLVATCTYIVAVAGLVNFGTALDTAMRAVDQAMDHGNIHLSWSEKEGLSITIGEDDG